MASIKWIVAPVIQFHEDAPMLAEGKAHVFERTSLTSICGRKRREYFSRPAASDSEKCFFCERKTK